MQGSTRVWAAGLALLVVLVASLYESIRTQFYRSMLAERGRLVASGPASLLARSTVVREAYLGRRA